VEEAVVNVYEAKTNLSRLLDRVERGDEVIVARAGRPVARLAPLQRRRRPVTLGVLEGRLRLPEGFDDDADAIADLFEGRSPSA
jgi:prevent-host-death family protein